MLPEDEEGAQAGHAVGVGTDPLGAEASAETLEAEPVTVRVATTANGNGAGTGTAEQDGAPPSLNGHGTDRKSVV